MARDGRRITFLVMLLAVAVVASGCIFLDTNRRNNFTGPSWDVDLAIPLVNDTYSLVGENGENLADISKLPPEHLGELVFELPDNWNGDTLPVGDLQTVAFDDLVPLDDVWAAIRDIEDNFPFVTLDIGAELRATVAAPAGVTGSIELLFESDGGTETAELIIDVSRSSATVDITSAGRGAGRGRRSSSSADS